MSRIGPREGREKDTKGIAKKKASREKKSPFPLLFVSSRLRASTASSRSSTYLVVGSSEHGPGASRRCGFLLRHGWFVFFFFLFSAFEEERDSHSMENEFSIGSFRLLLLSTQRRPFWLCGEVYERAPRSRKNQKAAGAERERED
jgi:hypothetical protein